MGTAFGTILGIIGALLVLTVLVVAHEYGHYKAGRLLNFKIMEFAVGMGPKLFKRVKHDIVYSIRALPIGGFTRFYGEEEDLDDAEAFNRQPIGRRAIVIAAGPFMNIVLAWLLAILFLCAFGDYIPTVNSVVAGSPAQQAGLKAGDVVLAINGNKLDFSSEIVEYTMDGFKAAPSFTIRRDGKVQEIKNIPLYYSAENKKSMIGITFGQQKQYFGFFEAIALSFKWMYFITKTMLVALFGLIFAGKGAADAMGPVGTIQVIGQVITTSTETVVQLGALLSINLAIINLMPFPALDGGRLVFLLLEKIRKKPLPKNAEGYLNFAGFVVLMLLMVVLTFQDISRMIS